METDTSTVVVKIETDILDMKDSNSSNAQSTDSNVYYAGMNGNAPNNSNIVVKEEIDNCTDKMHCLDMSVKQDMNYDKDETNIFNITVKEGICSCEGKTDYFDKTVKEETKNCEENKDYFDVTVKEELIDNWNNSIFGDSILAIKQIFPKALMVKTLHKGQFMKLKQL